MSDEDARGGERPVRLADPAWAPLITAEPPEGTVVSTHDGRIAVNVEQFGALDPHWFTVDADGKNPQWRYWSDLSDPTPLNWRSGTRTHTDDEAIAILGLAHGDETETVVLKRLGHEILSLLDQVRELREYERRLKDAMRHDPSHGRIDADIRAQALELYPDAADIGPRTAMEETMQRRRDERERG